MPGVAPRMLVVDGLIEPAVAVSDRGQRESSRSDVSHQDIRRFPDETGRRVGDIGQCLAGHSDRRSSRGSVLRHGSEGVATLQGLGLGPLQVVQHSVRMAGVHDMRYEGGVEVGAELPLTAFGDGTV